LGTLPNLPACNATALSQSGDVAGYCTAESGQNLLLDSPTTHVFLYSNGAMTDLNVTSPAVAFPTGVNNSGVVVGGAVKVSVATLSASAAPFIYENGALQAAPSQLQNTLPTAVNNAGQMAATSLQVSGGSFNFLLQSQAFLEQLSGSAVTDLAAPTSGASTAAFGINSNGEVAGASVAKGASTATPLLWQNSGSAPQALPLLSGYTNAIATSVNDSGVAAGAAFTINFSELSDPNAAAHAVLFKNGSVTDLGVPSGDVSSVATGINNSGSVVGFASNKPPDFTVQLDAYIAPPASKFTAFLYSGGQLYNLNNQLANGSGWQLSFATAINNAGQIAGTGLVNGAQHAFLLTPVLAPTTGNIVGSGFSTPGVTNISSNGIFTIFGTQLSDASQGIAAGDIVSNQLPTQLGGTCVENGSTKWNLFYVSPGQINVLAGQLPSSGAVPVKVVTNCGTANEVSSPEVNLAVGAVSPEFLYFLENKNGVNPVAAEEATNGSSPIYTYIGPPGLIPGATFAPAHPGDVLTAFGIGWGPTSPSVSVGVLASVPSRLTSSYSLTLGSEPVTPSYIGLSLSAAGLYQVNFTVPPGIAAGNQPLVLTVDGVSTTSNAYIAVAN
jgi:uncharacterized protein (TIGR03437 family)